MPIAHHGQMAEPTVRPGVIDGVLHVEPHPIRDARGFFVRTLDSGSLRASGLDPTRFVQENQSRSRRGTLRGLHCRRELSEGKLVRCAHGRAFEAIVDLRPWSRTFLATETLVLDDRAHRQVYVPPGCAHGFLVLSAVADICYRHDAVYAPELEAGVRWDDPEIGIAWPTMPTLLSDRDRVLPSLAEIRPELERWFGASPPGSTR
jgi:dTDP-4-dehydrorhamnose 3,5-epimerase